MNVDENQAIVEATVTTNGTIVERSAVIQTNSEVGIILDRTSAYSPAGSQISDKGHIQIKDLFFNFEKVRKIRDYVIHIGHFIDWSESLVLKLLNSVFCKIHLSKKKYYIIFQFKFSLSYILY